MNLSVGNFFRSERPMELDDRGANDQASVRGERFDWLFGTRQFWPGIQLICRAG